jgi:hypothetical protein
MSRNFIQRLYDCYNNLLECDLVKNKQVTPENLKQFRYILNSAQPINRDEYNHKDMIYALFRDIQEFYDFIMDHNMPYYLLWMKSKYIIDHFGLNNLVYMKWNKGLYHAYKYSKRAPTIDSQQSDLPPPQLELSQTQIDSAVQTQFEELVIPKASEI